MQTSQRGEAIFENLTPGKYAVHVESVGFDAQDFEQNVRRGNTNKQITLTIASFVEQVDVTRDDTEKALNDSFSTQLTQEQIEQLPDDADEMATVLEQMAGPGARMRVNGFQGGRLPPKSQIAEIRFRFDPFSAENHDARLPARRHPHAARQRRMAQLDDAHVPRRCAQRAQRESDRTRRRSEPARDVDGRRTDRQGQDVVLARARRPQFLRHGDDHQPARPIAPGLNTIEQPNDRLNIEARVEHALSKNHMLRVELQQNGNKQQNIGVGSFTEEIARVFAGSQRDHVPHQRKRIDQGPLPQRAALRVRARGHGRSRPRRGLQAINVLDYFNIGGAQRSGGRRTREMEIADDFDFTVGKKHAMRTGIEMESSWLRADEVSNDLGTFTFSSIEDFNARPPRAVPRARGQSRWSNIRTPSSRGTSTTTSACART